jgi:hypothetical protein
MFKGKIYRIYDISTLEEYIGSTKRKYISQRKAEHINDYKKYLRGKQRYISSYKIIQGGNFKIELIEEIDFLTKRDMLNKENEHKC